MSHRKHGRFVSVAWLLLLVVAAPAWSRAPQRRGPAEKPAAPVSAAVRASQLVGEGVLALASRDFAAAHRALSAAYRLQPSADTLFQLGIVAWSEGQSLTAQDFLRRYLADASVQPSADKRSEAQRIVDQLGADHSEVWVQGAAGSWVLVDNRLLGLLPLPLPLLLSPGTHQLAIESAAGDRTAVELSLQSQQAVIVRPGASSLTATPAARAVLCVGPWADRARSDALQRQAAERLLAQDLAILSVRKGQNPPSVCDITCCLRAAQEQQAQWAIVLIPAVSSDGKTTAGQIAVLDVAVKEVAAQASAFDPDQTTDAEQKELAATLPPLLQRARDRGRGTLYVTSIPDHAEVKAGSLVLGLTPLRIARFAGSLALEISASGFQADRRTVELTNGERTEIAVTLVPQPARGADVPVRPLRQPRPAWRIGLGVGALAAGVGMVVLGASALSVSGRCTEAFEPPVMACPRFFDTTAIGGVLVGTGAALGVAGALLVAWPGRAAPPVAHKGE